MWRVKLNEVTGSAVCERSYERQTMKHGDKVYYHRCHDKHPATWICWITRGDRRLAMMKVKGSHRHIEVALSDVEIGRKNDGTKI